MLTLIDGFPRHFGRYALLTSFGRGGMGEVYLAKQRVGDTQRLCVVKTLRGDLADSAEYIGRFKDESHVVVQLNHAHISQVYECGVIGTDHYLTMEFIHGVDWKVLLEDLRRRERPLDPGLALFIGAAVADALGYAHRLHSPITGEALKVVHRDVSTANVMLSFEGEVKLIDFGLAESVLKTEKTETRVVMGKVAYMSPEQARGEDVDGTCDQFAAAICVYEAASGERFYGDMNTHQIWQVVGRGGYVPRRWLELPAGLREVLGRALDANPSRRYADCDALAAALQEVRAVEAPRVGKEQLRQLLTELYGDRQERERTLIATFKDTPIPEEEIVTDTLGKPSMLPPSSTEPHLTTPSQVSPAAGPGFRAGTEFAKLPPTATDASPPSSPSPSPSPLPLPSSPSAFPSPFPSAVPSSPPVAPPPPSATPIRAQDGETMVVSPATRMPEVSEALVLPGNNAARWVMGALGVGVVVVVLGIVATRKPPPVPPPSPPPSPSLDVSATNDATLTPVIPAVAADAGMAPTDVPPSPTPVAPASSTTRLPHGARPAVALVSSPPPTPTPTPEPSVPTAPPPDPAPAAAGTPPAPEPSAETMSTAALEAVVARCAAIPDGVKALVMDRAKPEKARRKVLVYWYSRCR